MTASFLILCLLAVAFSTAVVYGVRRWALDHLLDVPNERSSHAVPTPRGGGLGIVLAALPLFVLALFTGDYGTGAHLPALLVFLVCAALIAALGWFDDRMNLSASVRLLLQLGIGAAVVIVIGAAAQTELPGLGVVGFAPLVALAINVVWVVGFTNIYNFMDGIDGIAGSQALIAGLGWAMLLLAMGVRDLALYAALVAASSLGFLFLNRPRALIFMGDVGSTFLGFSLAALPVLAFARTPDSRWLGAGALMVAPFLLDGAFTILRRALRRENVLKPHRSHIYQRLTAKGRFSHLHITSLYALYALVSVFCAWLYAISTSAGSMALAIAIPVLIFAALVAWTTALEKRALSPKG
ncbi:MAG: glycosyltransferase family 4 protein [bacterium]|nr:glycosyltransferase family 4 protein [bacterium]